MRLKLRVRALALALALSESAFLLSTTDVLAQSFGQLKDAATEAHTQKRFADEEAFWQKALEKYSSPSDPRYISALAGLAQSYEGQNKTEEADATYKKVVQAAPPGAVLSDEQKDALAKYSAFLSHNQRSEELATLNKNFGLLENTKAGADKTPAEVNTARINELIEQGKALTRRQQLKAAEGNYLKALELADRENASDIQQSDILNRIIALYYKQKKYSQAEPYFQRSMALVRKKKGASSPEYAEALSAHGQLLRILNRKTEAIAAESRAEEIMSHYGYNDGTVGSSGGGGSSGDSGSSSGRSAASDGPGDFGGLMNDLMGGN